MPYSQRQIKRILDEDGTPVLLPGRVENLTLRVTESYLRRKAYAWEDRAVGRQWDLFNAAYRDIRNFAQDTRDHHRVDTLERSVAVMRWRSAVDTFMVGRLREAMDAAAWDGFRSALTAYYAGYYGSAWQLDMLTDSETTLPTPAQQDAHMAILLPRLREQAEPDRTLYELMGADWRNRYEAELDEMIGRMRRSLETSISNAETMNASMRRLRDAMGIETNRRLGFSKNFHRVQTITRTFVMEASNQGMDTVYRANADLVAGTEWLAAHDGRVCALCQSLDGTQWPFGDPARRIPPMDSHPNCRCTIVPWMRYETVPDDSAPRLRFDEWLGFAGAGMLLGEYMDSGLSSTQV